MWQAALNVLTMGICGKAENHCMIFNVDATWRWCAKLLGMALMVINDSSAQETIAFNQAQVEELALFFAVESVHQVQQTLSRKVIKQMRKTGEDLTDRIQAINDNPPLANAQGVVHPFGPNNPLSFVYNAHDGSMTVWSRIIKKRGQIGYYGLTAVELAVALNQTTDQQRDRAGGYFAFDATADALSLKLHYPSPPVDRQAFYGAVDHLIRARLAWSEQDRFLNAAVAAAEAQAPPNEATASLGDWSATLVLRHFSVYPQLTAFYVNRYRQSWDRPHGVRAPLLVSDQKLWINQVINGMVHFRGLQADDQGTATITAQFSLTGPDGAVEFAGQELLLWQGPPPPTDHLQIGMQNLSWSFDQDAKPGKYLIEASICDQAGTRCLKLSHPFELLSTP